VIRNGVDLSRFEAKGETGRLRREIGVPPDVPLVAVVARLHELKGLGDFLEAAARLAGRHDGARFLIVGGRLSVKNGVATSDDTYARELALAARRLGLGDRVVFTGFRLDVADLLREVAVSVLPSLSEGLSNVLLESMAAGVPVVTTPVGGSPEAVVDGETGFLVPTRSPEALARAIDTLLTDLALAVRMGQAGRRRIEARFSLKGMTRATERLYVSLLEGRRFDEGAELDPARQEAV